MFASPQCRRLLVWLGVLCCSAPVTIRANSATAPIFAAVPESSASTKALQVVGTDLYVAAWGNGVQILDIADPSRPRWKGGWNPQQCPVGIHVVGTHAFVANRRAGLAVLDVSDAANPIPVGSLDLVGDAIAVHAAGHLAFVANYPQGFSIVDVQDPARPGLLSTVALPQAASSLQVAGDYLYVTEPNGLHVFSIRDPRQPVRVGEQPLFGPLPRVQIIGDMAWLATGQNGLVTFSLATPESPAFLDRLMIWTNQLPVLVRAGPRQFQQVGMVWMLTNTAWRTDLQKRYGTNLPGTLVEIVTAIRNSPQYHWQTSGRRGITRTLNGLHVTGQYALALAYRDALEVIDVTTPAAPWLVGRIQLTGPTWDVRAAHGYAYVMDTGANIHVVDLREPKQPIQVTQFLSRNYASRVLAVAEAETPSTPPAAYPDAAVSADAPEVGQPQWQPDGAFSFELKGVGGARYVIQASADLRGWTAIATNTLPAAGQARIADSEARKFARRFYRAWRTP